MTYIRTADYSDVRARPKLLTNYVEQMTLYLKTMHPTASEESIQGFVKEIVRERAKAPQVESIVHKSEGNSELATIRLDHYIRDIVKDNNLSPSGTCYLPISTKQSFLRLSIDGKIKARNKFKKRYLEAEAQGEKREATYYNLNQANSKIFNNAIAGGMKIKQFILGCKAGFNAITSSGRMSVKQGYSFIERAVNGNIYLPSMRDALTYALNHARHVHPDFGHLIHQGTLYTPTIEEVVNYLTTNVQNYTNKLDTTDLTRVIEGITAVQRAYIFYAGCINNLCRYNEVIMRSWIDSCFVQGPVDPSLYRDIDPAEIKTFRDDVISCMLSTNYQRLGKKPGSDTKWNSLKDAAKNNPDGLREFIYVARHFVSHFENFVPILRPVLQIQTTFSKLTFQHRMARYTVPLSDTDSNIFSTQELIRWKRGKIDFTQESYEMNAIVTFMLSQSLEHVFARLSAGFGAEGQDVYRISMKNEFLYPILIATALAKHYLAIATMQEGSLLPTPRKDIKGVGFRSSSYPKIITKGFESFVVDLFALIEKAEPIRAGLILKHVADIEQTIYTSIQNRESDYLQTVSIRRMEDYTDPMSSSYFYYEMWKAVFAEEYGEMVIPTKCYKIPFRGGKKLLKDPVFVERMRTEYPGVYKRLMAFMELHPKRDIAAVLIPPFKGQIHPFFLEIMDIRDHICKVMAGYYHVLDALGIGTVDIRVGGLVSDFFDPSTALLE
jgi:hypothetical protein